MSLVWVCAEMTWKSGIYTEVTTKNTASALLFSIFFPYLTVDVRVLSWSLSSKRQGVLGEANLTPANRKMGGGFIKKRNDFWGLPSLKQGTNQHYRVKKTTRKHTFARDSKEMPASHAGRKAIDYLRRGYMIMKQDLHAI